MIKNKFYFLLTLGIILWSCSNQDEIIGTAVSDMLWLEHEGAQMPIRVEGNTSSKTFILFLHGGPGGTSTSYNASNLDMSRPLEERYALAYWDQRLAGNSRGQFDPEDLTLELMLEDTDLVIDLLRSRYGQDISIFLLGHSWGGYLGNAYLAESEENQAKISGWIDVAGAHDIQKVTRDAVTLMQEIAAQQIAANTDQKDNWEKVLEFTNEVSPVNGVDKDLSLRVNQRANSALAYAREDQLIMTSTPKENEAINTFWYENNLITNIFNSVETGKTEIWKDILNNSLSGELHKIKTPALLLWGKYDFVVPPSLGEEAFEKLGADEADKFFHIFENSGHSPTHTESELLVDLVIDFVDAY